jgi:hypothetical protein
VGRRGTVHPDGSRYTGSFLAPGPVHANYQPTDDTGWCDWFFRWVGLKATDGYDTVYSYYLVVAGGVPFWHDMNPDKVGVSFKDADGDGCGTEVGDADNDGIADEHFGDGEDFDQGCGDLMMELGHGQVTVDTDDNYYARVNPLSAWYDPVYSLPANHTYGDYVGMNGHVGMFLAFDPNGDGSYTGADTVNVPAVGTVWTIDGNNGQQVRVVPHPGNTSFILGYGRLARWMFRQ